jgi:hypothetical protein
MQCTCAILSSVACPAVQYFYTLSYKWCDFRKKKVIETKMCVLIFSTAFFYEIFLILRRTERDVKKKNIYIYIGLHVKYPLFLSHFNKISIFSTHFLNIF